MSNTFSIMVLFLAPVLILTCFVDTVRAGSAVVDGLIAYWSFDEDTIDGEVVKDVVQGIEGTFQGAPEPVAGKVGGAILLGGADSVLVSSEVEAINRDYSEITLECWAFINAHDDSWNRILSLDERSAGVGNNSNIASLYYDSDDEYYAFMVSNVGARVEKGLPVEEWLHMVGTWDGATANYYENGELVTSIAAPVNLTGGNFSFGMGDRADGANADAIQGIIDEVRIYEKALSEAEVKQNFEAEGTTAVSQEKLAATWGKMKTSW